MQLVLIILTYVFPAVILLCVYKYGVYGLAMFFCYNHRYYNISLRPLRSLDRHDLFVPRARTSMAQTRAFAIIGPSLWNQLLPSTRSTLLTGEPSASFRSLKTALFSLGLSP